MIRLSKAAWQAVLTQSQKQVADLTKMYHRNLGEYAALKARLTEYEHRLNKMSHNSSKPTSCDGLRKPKVPAKKSTSFRQSAINLSH